MKTVRSKLGPSTSSSNSAAGLPDFYQSLPLVALGDRSRGSNPL